jgi:NitT/TauT family transport system permease protein
LLAEEIILHSISSLTRVFVGWFIAVLCGVTLGLIRSSFTPKMRNNFLLNFIIEAPKYPPPIAWIPFIILLFGVSEQSAYAIVFIGAFPPIFTSCYEAAINIPDSITRITNTLELSRLQKLFKIIIYYIAPEIFTSLKVAAGIAWMCVIAAEMISGQSGLGYAIQLSRMNMQYNEVIYYMLIIGIIGFFINWSLNLLEKVVLPWSIKGKGYAKD